jgi:FkbM family methyltransferase
LRYSKLHLSRNDITAAFANRSMTDKPQPDLPHPRKFMCAFHSLLHWYYHLPNHPGKLRIYYWLRSLPGLRHAVSNTSFGILKLDILDYVQHEIFLNSVYEPRTFRRFMSLLSVGDCAIDVGANIGQYALGAASKVGDTGIVLAIEPNPHCCEQLLWNRRANPHGKVIEVILSAISDPPELLEFGIPPTSALGLSRPLSLGSGQESFWVRPVTLNSLLTNFSISAIRVIKIDVEGGEFTVLRSLLDHSEIRPEHIIFEFLPDSFGYGVRPGDFCRYLAEFRYDLLTVEGDEFEPGKIPPEGNVWARLQN